MKTTSYGMLNIGKIREINEDFIGMDEKIGLFVLGDGMGGHACGEVASREFVRTALEYFHDKTLLLMSEDEVLNHIGKAISIANRIIFDMASADNQKKGMGTTAVVLAFSKKHFVVGWVGDSRLYLFRGGELVRITKDHSRVQMMVDARVIDDTEARSHPDRNVILKAVGINEIVTPDFQKGKVKQGDMYLLCSDGITEELDDNEIRTVLNSKKEPRDACIELIALADEKGGSDNQSVIIVRVDECR